MKTSLTFSFCLAAIVFFSDILKAENDVPAKFEIEVQSKFLEISQSNLKPLGFNWLAQADAPGQRDFFRNQLLDAPGPGYREQVGRFARPKSIFKVNFFGDHGHVGINYFFTPNTYPASGFRPDQTSLGESASFSQPIHLFDLQHAGPEFEPFAPQKPRQ